MKPLQTWFAKKHRDVPVTYPEQVVRQHALRRLAHVFQVAEASLSLDDRFGEQLTAAPPSAFRFNAFDTVDDDIKWVSDNPLLRAMASGDLVIRTVGDYCDHMVHCSRINAKRVADVLEVMQRA